MKDSEKKRRYIKERKARKVNEGKWKVVRKEENITCKKKKRRNYLTVGKKTRGNNDRQGIYMTRSEQNQVKGKMAAKRKRMI